MNSHLFVKFIKLIMETISDYGYDRLLVIYISIHNHVIMKHFMTPTHGQSSENHGMLIKLLAPLGYVP